MIYHTDRGVHYTALSLGKRLKEVGIVPSMARTGSALDNAISESFGARKTELLHRHRFISREAARTAIFFGYMEGFYNWVRRPSSLGYLSPTEYEEVTMEATKEVAVM